MGLKTEDKIVQLDTDNDVDDAALEESLKLASELQQACSAGQLEKCKELIDKGALAWQQDPSTGWSALHYAADNGSLELVNYLLRNGAVWNLVDNVGFTASDVAYSLNNEQVFNAIVMEGVRMEMVQAILNAQSNEDGSENDEEENEDADMPKKKDSDTVSICMEDGLDDAPKPSTASDNKAFLKSKLRYETDENGEERCIDEEGNGVMMGWELPIMQDTARLLAQDRDINDSEAEFAVLNVGFGLGLVDAELQKYKPTRHVIIEPHPDVLAHARKKGWYEIPGVEFFEGTWREYIAAFQAGEQLAEFDAIYFDTFSEHYADLHAFFEELPNLLKDDTSRFSFFHGLGATSMSFYEVYTHVSEMHLSEIGLKTEWYEVDMNSTDKGQVTWEGIVRRYWNIPCPYRLPICQLDF
ncbi:S-adenosyl-L-methionine-dependent methyltransferase [Cystobasidium minutum MCA 4210]|uniref:S-adenosyl-L-methionine-dependent methyltransferase n=1 Tax=Cystobasidium minutum MCA 4210 TaxID=1397322 RepID=UPI0034CEEC36|eukprot:jgi/Rhomi1/195188/gm1.3402_g